MTSLSRACVSIYQYATVTMSVIYIVPFLRYSASNIGVTLKSGLGSFKVIEMVPFDILYRTYYWSAFVNILHHFQVI